MNKILIFLADFYSYLEIEIIEHKIINNKYHYSTKICLNQAQNEMSFDILALKFKVSYLLLSEEDKLCH